MRHLLSRLRAMKKLILLLFSLPCFGTSVVNMIQYVNPTGSSQSNILISIGRPFPDGIFTGNNYPVAQLCTDATCTVLTGSPLTTQVDVKNRWGSGAIKQANIHFILASAGANSTVNISLAGAQLGCGCGYSSALKIADMLSTASPNYDFDAIIDLFQPFANDHQTT